VNENDRRSVHIHLTPKGDTALRRLRKGFPSELLLAAIL
jgi:DNA-binding MarR family transcriptional regulator